MAITKKAIQAQQKNHTYFFFTVDANKISGLIAKLPAGAHVKQFTFSFGTAYSAWGTYTCDRAALLSAVSQNGGYGFRTQADFMGD